MNISKELGVESFISRAVALGQEFLERSSQTSSNVTGQVAKLVGTDAPRLADNTRDALATSLTSAAKFIGARRSKLRNPLFITLGVGAAAAAAAYYNREKIKAAAVKAKDAVEPQVRHAAKTIQEKISHRTDDAKELVEKRHPSNRSATTH